MTGSDITTRDQIHNMALHGALIIKHPFLHCESAGDGLSSVQNKASPSDIDWLKLIQSD